MNRTIRSLECWAVYGVAGQKESDGFAAREALIRHCRYGLNEMGRLVFVYLPGVELHVEREIQSERLGDNRTTQDMPAVTLAALLGETCDGDDELTPIYLDSSCLESLQ